MYEIFGDGGREKQLLNNLSNRQKKTNWQNKTGSCKRTLKVTTEEQPSDLVGNPIRQKKAQRKYTRLKN